jgi:hypothetical protein
MRARGSGVIVNVSSTSGRLPGFLYNGFYFASKKALGSLSESLAWELEPLGIRVMCIEPGLFATEIFDNSHWFDPRPASPYTTDQTWFTAAMTNWVATGAAGGSSSGHRRRGRRSGQPLHVLVGEDAALVGMVTEAGTSNGPWSPNQLLNDVLPPRNPQQSTSPMSGVPPWQRPPDPRNAGQIQALTMGDIVLHTDRNGGRLGHNTLPPEGPVGRLNGRGGFPIARTSTRSWTSRFNTTEDHHHAWRPSRCVHGEGDVREYCPRWTNRESRPRTNCRRAGG